MNLNALKTFLTILESGSLIRAAQQLNVTQSTVTARLKTLEEELGQVLINRQKSGATVTPAGQRLVRHAQTITDLWYQARKETALPGAFSGICNIGCHPDLWPHLGERLFDWVRQNQPNIAVSISQGGQHDLAAWLNSGLIDLALSYWPSNHPQQVSHALATDELFLFATSPNHPIRFDPKYVFVEGGDDFGKDHAATYADADTARISFGSAVMGLAHIKQNGGSAYLPNRIAKNQGLFRLDAPSFTRKSYLITNTNARNSWPWFEQAMEFL